MAGTAQILAWRELFAHKHCGQPTRKSRTKKTQGLQAFILVGFGAAGSRGRQVGRTTLVASSLRATRARSTLGDRSPRRLVPEFYCCVARSLAKIARGHQSSSTVHRSSDCPYRDAVLQAQLLAVHLGRARGRFGVVQLLGNVLRMRREDDPSRCGAQGCGGAESVRE